MSARRQDIPVVNELIVLGYGYAKLQADQLFTASELINVLNAADTHAEKPHSITIRRCLGSTASAGLISAEWRTTSPYSKVNPARIYELLESGQEKLFLGLSHHILGRTKTLPELLVIPESIDAVLEQGNFMAHIESILLGSAQHPRDYAG